MGIGIDEHMDCYQCGEVPALPTSVCGFCGDKGDERGLKCAHMFGYPNRLICFECFSMGMDTPSSQTTTGQG